MQLVDLVYKVQHHQSLWCDDLIIISYIFMNQAWFFCQISPQNKTDDYKHRWGKS